ncbi:transglycosylase domain-containing protein [Streptomyces sp. TRM68367]|uniref:transglycosylase domain-containing protein n=1 Tax=Streptomyces sp. TRM68367 TaxID=2758415 RepID=UPI0021CF89A7|nr:transglycosylase domain-containing protein [Streptomyces sp. TRM68367]
MRRATQTANRRSSRRKTEGHGPGARPAASSRRGAPGKRRLIDYPRTGRRGLRRWLPSWKQVLTVFVLLFGGTVGAVGFAYASVSIPSVNPSTQLQNNLFYWSDGSRMASVGQVNRQNVSLSQVPSDVQWDFLAAENASFYTDPGVDPQGILRALYHMAEGGQVQSGSTITQQFVKNTYLSQDQSLSRKFKEIMISLKIGAKLSKQQILQGYLNSNYYGRGAYGIEAAAQAYYHRPVEKLNVSQGAFLAATVNEPSVMMNADDPHVRPQATARWKYVLGRMVAIGKLSATQEQRYLREGFPVPKPMTASGSTSGQVGYLVQIAQQYVEQHSSITDQQLNQGGYQIYTTFDKHQVAELSASVARMRKQHLDPKHRSADRNVQVGAASVDPATGAIVALYGGDGWNKGHYTDNANSSGVPVGSTFKPFVLAAALDHGAVLSPGQPPSPVTPESRFDGDNGIEIKNQQGQYLPDGSDPTGLLHQQNDVSTKWGYITLRKAMEQSVNTPYVQLGEYVGYDNVENEALAAGLLRSSLQYDTAGFYIGTSTPSAIRMADAYGTFADDGVHHEPYSVTKVLDGGRQLSGFTAPSGTRAMPASTADTVTNVLQDVVEHGTGTNALALGRPAAGKTGTTDDYKSAWFIGYTPQLSTAVSMFKEGPGNSGLKGMAGVGGYSKVFGADMPTQVWLGYMSAALQGRPVKSFPPTPPLGQGANENGAPSPTPSASPTESPSSPPSPTTPAPSPSITPCSDIPGGCASPTAPTPSPSPTSTNGLSGGLFGPGGGKHGSGGAQSPHR